MIDRLEADAQLADIEARRVILFNEHRSSTLPEAEFFEKLRRLDSEEQYWRVRVKTEETPLPRTLPVWGEDLWKQTIVLSADVDAWRDERRAERLIDVRERQAARLTQYRFFALILLWQTVITIALYWLGSQVWRITELWR